MKILHCHHNWDDYTDDDDPYFIIECCKDVDHDYIIDICNKDMDSPPQGMFPVRPLHCPPGRPEVRQSRGQALLR